MALYAAMWLLMPLLALAGIWEGARALIRRSREKRQWKYLREVYYPRCEY